MKYIDNTARGTSIGKMKSLHGFILLSFWQFQFLYNISLLILKGALKQQQKSTCTQKFIFIYKI